jgi:probable DNA metabolism protein
MFVARVEPPWDLDAWRDAARAAWCAQVAPEAIEWNGDAQGSLIGGQEVLALTATRQAPRVTSDFMMLANAVLCHRDSQRHALLYRLLWRIGQGERGLLDHATDPDVHRAEALAKSVRRDTHKMKAFVRFREVPGEVDAFVAWFEPEHYIVERVAPFFARRFAGMRWAILTPYRSAHWDGQALASGPGGTRADAPADDAREALWKTYYANIFNPARLNPTMMRSEMPQKYWKHLPEAQLLPGLIQSAGTRVREMAERAPVLPRRRIPQAPAVPEPIADGSLASIRDAALACRRCELWQPATRTVFGEGPEDARVVLIGEQPGDEEDLSGRPFVGPAGKLLDRVLKELGIDRRTLYLTNAVKHFRFEQRGKRRLHRNPTSSQVQACRPWLQQEMARIDPQFIVCLGANAARTVLGGDFRLMEQRGQWRDMADGAQALATVHPSWILRQPEDARQGSYALLKQDLGLLASMLSQPA